MSGCVINKTTISTGEAACVDLLKRQRRTEERKTEKSPDVTHPERPEPIRALRRLAEGNGANAS